MNFSLTAKSAKAAKKKPLLFVVGLFGLFLLLTACAGTPSTPSASPQTDPAAVYATPDSVPTSTPFQPGASLPTAASPLLPLTVDAPPAPTVTESLNLVVDINPLTGLPPADPVLLERRPLAIKISNFQREIRPQYGLTLTDQAFEYYIEWGDTRFIGIFYGNNSEKVGPVRSGRFFDEHVARMFKAFLVFNYADPREWNYLKGSDLYQFLVIPSCTGGVCPPFFVSRIKDVEDAEHFTNYFDTTRFNDFAKEKGVNNSRQTLRNGFFSETVPASEGRVQRIYTTYSERSYNYWEYDSATHKYLRYQETVTVNAEAGVPETYAPLIDAVTNQQVNAENVVVLFVSHTFANKFNAEDEVYNIQLVDEGLAYVFRDGVVIPARWARPEKDQLFFLTTRAGDPIYLRPGRTFYEVIGVTSTMIQNGLDWRFIFQTP
jgi:hypothetical protein